MSKSSIEWTSHTWNPVVGCSIVSPGCTNCYAMKQAARCEAMGTSRYDGTTKHVNGKAVWTGKLARAPEATLLAPLRRKKPTTYFVNSMGDLFHEDCPDEWIDQVFAVMALCPQHTFQVLTKRAKRMRDYLTRPASNGQQDVRNHLAWVSAAEMMDRWFPNWKSQDIDEIHRARAIAAFTTWPLPNVWLGVSAERQQEADERIPLLLQTPAAIRFISAEPLLGPLSLADLHGPDTAAVGHPLIDAGAMRLIEGLDWVIVGGESGSHARPMSVQWAREIRDQCFAAGKPFFFKQFGEWRPAGIHRSETPGRFAFGDYEYDRAVMNEVDGYPRQFTMFGARSVMERVGKKRAGRLLDGIEHNGFPTVETL